MNPESSPNMSGHTISRRSVVFGSVAAVGAAALEAGCRPLPEPTRTPTPSPRPRPTLRPLPTEAPTAVATATQASSPTATATEALRTGETGSCMNLHVSVEADANDNLTYEAYVKDVDLLAVNGIEEIRLNIKDYEVVESVAGGELKWKKNGNNLRLYEKAIDYARSKNMAIHLVTNVPGSAADLEMPEYLKATETYYKDLGALFKGKVKTWQIFNEPNVHHFANYSDINFYDSSFNKDDYLKNLKQVVAVAYDTIKQADPQALVTLNLSRWVGRHVPLPNGFTDEAKDFFGALMPYVDVLTLDFYPDTNQNEIAKLPQYVADLNKAFNKPVLVGEIGLPVNGSFTLKDQEQTIVQSIESLQGGQIKPIGICIYEMRDEAKQITTNEGRFGIADVNGKPKTPQIFQKIRDAIKRLRR